jgi:hypothetical protein
MIAFHVLGEYCVMSLGNIARAMGLMSDWLCSTVDLRTFRNSSPQSFDGMHFSS